MHTTTRPGDMTVSQAAAVLGVSRASIYRFIEAGRLPAYRLGPKTTRIARADLEALRAEHAMTDVAPSAASAAS